MITSLYWADSYLTKRLKASEAIKKIRSGQRIFIGSACGEPQELVRALNETGGGLTGLELVRLMSFETPAMADLYRKSEMYSRNVRIIYLGAARAGSMIPNRRFITPLNLSEVPDLFLSRKLPIDVALIQTSPPDDFGWMSLGVSVDVTLAAANSADIVIAQVNPRMPRVLGRSFIHMNDVDIIVEHEEDVLTVPSQTQSDATSRIGEHIARLIEDGATLQIGLDAASQAALNALSDKNDLGIHSQYITDDIMHLYSMGIINNRKKGLNEGKIVASAAIGSTNLYEFINDNPAVDFHPSNYVNDPFIIRQHHRMTSMNTAHAIDLTGQVTAESSARTYFTGITGISDFVQGSRRSAGGKSIMILLSTSEDGSQSRIVPNLDDAACVVPRGDAQYVVTEYGVVNLFGKSLQERAMAMIEIAHPDFRQQLFDAAKERGLIGTDRSLGEAVRGVYPVWMEEVMETEGISVTIRPSKPVDERRIQEHYYNLEKEDVLSRFFNEKTIFGLPETEQRSKIDYIKDLTILALVGEFGFGRVIAVGESMYLPELNMSEVAFSVNRKYQGKGIARRVIAKLAKAAKENGISGLIAYTNPQNKKMINLFKSLPYPVKSQYGSEGLKLECYFDDGEVG
ncbi:MAG: GNAT family N-acetyltransferase [Deltaproteobacteria bacterium]|nr:GNAT family N-acetyltransferase [Deltaproteobacteria bacterium]